MFYSALTHLITGTEIRFVPALYRCSFAKWKHFLSVCRTGKKSYNHT